MKLQRASYSTRLIDIYQSVSKSNSDPPIKVQLSCNADNLHSPSLPLKSKWIIDKGTRLSILLNVQEDVDLAAVYGKALDKKKKRKKKGKCEHLVDYPLLPTVQLGIASSAYTANATGTFTCYASSEYVSGALHTVLLGRASPLVPGVQYFYRVGDPQFGWGEEFQFTTPVPVSRHSTPYRCLHTSGLNSRGLLSNRS